MQLFCALISPNIFPGNAEQELLSLGVPQVAEGSTAVGVWELTWQSPHCLPFPTHEWRHQTFRALCLCSDAPLQWAPCWHCTFMDSSPLWMLNEGVKVRYAEYLLPWTLLAKMIILFISFTIFFINGNHKTTLSFNFQQCQGPKAEKKKPRTKTSSRALDSLKSLLFSQ